LGKLPALVKLECKVADCHIEAHCRGWCKRHYETWRLHGDPLYRYVRDDLARFWAKVNKDGPIPARRPDLGPCWVWAKGLDPDGYAVFRYKGGQRAHRFIYEQMVKPIPKGLVIDHLCRNRACVRPDHLEVVTSRVNILRGEAPPAINAAREVCSSGHELTDENTYIFPNGKRACRICRRRWQREWKRRQAGAGARKAA
jgi:hypothetical protein